MGRTVIVGDVHGCVVELERLLDRVAFSSGDQLVLVGDLVARGPDSLGVLDVARQTGAILVRGNHEQRLLVLRRAPVSELPGGRMHRDIVAALRPVDWTLLETSPLWVDLPEHGVRVVHAGVIPGLPIEQHTPATLMRIRTVRVTPEGIAPASESMAPSKARAVRSEASDVLWGSCYTGPPHVVFGHNAAPGLQLHPWATGLDTGCVYGGSLTAMVLRPGEKVPRSPRARRSVLVHQVAARTYFAPTGPHVSRAYAA